MTSHNKETLSGYCSQSVPQRAHCYEQKWCHKNDDSRRSLGHQKMNGQERIHQHTSNRNFVLKFFYHQKYEFLGEQRNDMHQEFTNISVRKPRFKDRIFCQSYKQRNISQGFTVDQEPNSCVLSSGWGLLFSSMWWAAISWARSRAIWIWQHN